VEGERERVEMDRQYLLQVVFRQWSDPTAVDDLEWIGANVLGHVT